MAKITAANRKELETVTRTSRIDITQVENLDDAIKLDCYNMDTVGFRLAASFLSGDMLILIYQRH